MRKVLLILFCSFIVVVGHSQDFEFVKKIKNVKATIHFTEDKRAAIIIPDSNTSMRYISKELPEEYKVEGLHITFTGKEAKIAPYMRLIATPLQLQSVSVSGKDRKRLHLKKVKYTFKG